MRHSVSISLPAGIFKEFKGYCKRENASASEIIRQALRVYFFRREFSNLRRLATLENAKRGINVTEEEIFKQIS